MPDSFGKRNRERVKAKKAEERDERRIARSQRRKGLTPTTERDQTEINGVLGSPLYGTTGAGTDSGSSEIPSR